MKKLYCRVMYFIVAFFLFVAAASLLQAQTVVQNFESYNIGDHIAGIGWSQADIKASVANDPLASGNKVLMDTVNNYNAAPVVQLVLPPGKTLANYGTFTFKGYFAQGDVGYKTIEVEAYQSSPTGHAFKSPDADSIGSWNRALGGSSAWENISIPIANSSSLHDTIYVAFGINCAGTGNIGGTGVATIWYADNVTLVTKPAANLNSIFAISRNSIDFGSDTVGSANQDSVRIYNRGTDTLKITPISSTNALFTFSPSVFSIAPSDSSKLTITYTPVDTSSQSGFIILTTNAAGSPDSISVKGKGIGKSLPIVTNGGFESSNTGVVDTTAVKGWLIQTASTVSPAPVFQIVSDTVEEGSRALKVTVNAAGTNQWDIQAVVDSLHVKPGGVYNYSVWAKAANPGAQVNFTVGNYSYSEYKVIRPAALTTQWQKFAMQFTVTDNQVVIRGPIHFSYASNVGNTIYIDNLQIAENAPADTGTVWKGPALATGASKFLGNAYGDVPDNIFANYWTQLTPGNAGKWGTIAGSQDTTQWNWSELDGEYNYAVTNHLVFKDHNLIWGQQQPSWISSLDSATQAKYIEIWIRNVGQRYPKIDMIDVVNEALAGHNPPDGGGSPARANYKNALGGNGTTGWDWVINSFKLARKYLPNAKLLINDYGIINDNTATTSYLQVINLLHQQGLIDGIGVQGHRFELENGDTSTYKSNLDRLAATGLPVYISEMDLGNLGDTGTPDDNQQLQLYTKIFPALWRHPGVKGITLWGYLDGQMWQTTCYLVRSDGTARPALLWLAQYVSANPMDVKGSTLQLPSSYELKQNFPNPFNPTTNIQYSLPKASTVTLKVYDILGRLVQTLVKSEQNPGNYSVTFNAQNFSSGVYFYQLQAGGFTETKKLMLLK